MAISLSNSNWLPHHIETSLILNLSTNTAFKCCTFKFPTTAAKLYTFHTNEYDNLYAK